MKKHLMGSLLLATTFSFLCLQANAAPIAVSFTKLTGLTGGTPQGTAVYKADLTSIGLATVASVSITDASGGFGGAAGQFSGFDLDAIKLSTTSCDDATCANALSGVNVFDFTPAGTIFTAGTQRAPTDPKLFGTDASGTQVDNTVATLQSFDGNSTTAIPGAEGFLSMGDFGKLIFNLTSSVSTSGLYLYIGEVGDNGEVAGSSILVSDSQQGVPEPAVLILLIVGIAGMSFQLRRKQL